MVVRSESAGLHFTPGYFITTASDDGIAYLLDRKKRKGVRFLKYYTQGLEALLKGRINIVNPDLSPSI